MVVHIDLHYHFRELTKMIFSPSPIAPLQPSRNVVKSTPAEASTAQKSGHNSLKKTPQVTHKNDTWFRVGEI
jgi:hypothetical protein